MHLVRNAVDHGIETPTQRAGAGKPGVATISVEASQVGDRLLVTVRDDGRGIDPATVRRKAAERGMLPAEELAALTDGQLTDLIFAAGFSTASE
ncbi:ATP-binding protein, partial [Lacticaseibacillus paracasei]|uniref:ATP-binding protein n=1 Tax=Lacticaseibacillus paracasei TaxID=1597 RepID=UPI001DBD6856